MFIVQFYNIQSNLLHSEHGINATTPKEAEQEARKLLNNAYGRNVNKPTEDPQDYAQYFRAVVLDENGEPTDVKRPEPAAEAVSDNSGWENFQSFRQGFRG